MRKRKVTSNTSEFKSLHWRDQAKILPLLPLERKGMWNRIKSKFHGKKCVVSKKSPLIPLDHPALYPSTDEERLEESELRREAAMCKGAEYERKFVRDQPHAERGKKLLQAESKGGRVKAESNQNRIQTAIQELEKYRSEHPNVSLTAARNRIAERYNISRRTLERRASTSHPTK